MSMHGTAMMTLFAALVALWVLKSIG